MNLFGVKAKMQEAVIWNKIDKTLQENGTIILYGAGLIGHLIYDSLKNRCNLNNCLFCTSYEPEHFDKITGLKVLNRESLKFYTDALVIVCLGITFSNKIYEEIKNYCLKVGIREENLILRTSDWFLKLAKPYIDAKGELHVYTLSFHVTKMCNLKCRMCGQLLFGPVKRRSFPSEQIMEDTDKIFKVIDHIGVMKLIGGEVMMYRDLDKLIHRLNEYNSKIGLLELYTNGAVMPKPSLLEAIKSYKGFFQVTISDYGKLSCAKEKWLEFCSNAGVTVNVLNFSTLGHSGFKGWIDCRELKDLNESPDENLEKFIKCGQRIDFVLEDSILGKCTSFHMLNYALNYDLSREESVYLHDNLSDDEIKKKIVELGTDDVPLGVCKYCIWGSNIRDSLPRFPAAEQMDKFPR